jgi:hypothetical protein
MSLLTNVIDPGTQQPRSRMFWAVLGAVVAVQISAFYLLCSHQVRRAEARQTEAVVQQMAMSDCLQYIPGSTIASCSGRGEVQADAQRATKVGGATPVSFSFR